MKRTEILIEVCGIAGQNLWQLPVSHTARNLCVAVTYTDVRGEGEEMLAGNATNERALHCLTSADQNVGGGSGTRRRSHGKDQVGVGERTASSAPKLHKRPARRRAEHVYGVTILERWGGWVNVKYGISRPERTHLALN